uniref:Uncharacterized protein n=1 Tax=Clytia hemisphaerica TaxID=252671 RepID=A0A7M5UT63_9CNID
MPAPRSSSVAHLNANRRITPSVPSPKRPTSRRIPTSYSQPNLQEYGQSLAVATTSNKETVKKKVKKKKKKAALVANLAQTRYSLVKQVCSDYGFVISDHSSTDA